MKLLIKKGTTSKLVEIFVQDSSQTDGSGLAGLVYDTHDLSWYYYRSGAASAAEVTLADMTIGTWASGGFKEISALDMPGVYQIGIPDAALAGGTDQVVMMLKGADNMAPVPLEIQLEDNIYQGKVVFIDDNRNASDRYLVSFAKNGEPVVSGVTNPTITITKDDGTEIVHAETLSQIGSTGYFLYTETTNRLVSGYGYVAEVVWTQDGASRLWVQPVGRDSSG